MSDPTYQTKNYGKQGGSVYTVDSGGRIEVLSGGTSRVATGGSIQVESGAVLNIAAGGSVIGNGVSLTAPVFNIMTVGGTIGKWSFGTASLTSGVGTIGIPGFTRVFAAVANEILGEASGAGSTTSVQIDLSLAAAGSIIFHTSIGTLPAAVGGTVTFFAMGT